MKITWCHMRTLWSLLWLSGRPRMFSEIVYCVFISPQDHFIFVNINLFFVVMSSSVISGTALQLQTLIFVFSSICLCYFGLTNTNLEMPLECLWVSLSRGAGGLLLFKKHSFKFSWHWTPQLAVGNTHQEPIQVSRACREAVSYICYPVYFRGYVLTKQT